MKGRKRDNCNSIINKYIFKKRKKYSGLKVSRIFSLVLFLRKLFENEIHENEGVNKPKNKEDLKSRKGNQTQVKAKGDF